MMRRAAKCTPLSGLRRAHLRMVGAAAAQQGGELGFHGEQRAGEAEDAVAKDKVHARAPAHRRAPQQLDRLQLGARAHVRAAARAAVQAGDLDDPQRRAGIRACDPKRLAIYFTKHSSPNANGDKEYQHIVPAAWRALGKGPGRFWGAAGLKKVTATVEIDQSDYVNARRIVRRWSRNQAAYSDITAKFPSAVNPRTANVSVPRVDSETGRVTFRRVRRRRQLCKQGGLAGGFALANNGPEFASQLARALSMWVAPDG